jgi:hypothetical protein
MRRAPSPENQENRRLKLFLSLAIVLSVVSSAAAEPAAEPTPAAEPSAQQLMDDMVARLPMDPLSISGDIILRKRHGIVVRELKFRMELNWGKKPATAQYTIMDALGAKLEEMSVSREEGKSPQFTHSSSATDGRGNVMPDLSAAIQDTDISWTDLTLSFLWWKGESIIGREEVKGRPCYIVAVRPPETGKGGQYSEAHLWLDEKLHMLLQAQGFDKDGKLVRSLWVQGFKKMNDRWMIKEMEIQSSPVHRTKLLIDDVNDPNAGKGEEPKL